MKLFDRGPLLEELQQRGLSEWAQQLQVICGQRFQAAQHGNLPKWIAAWQALPNVADTRVDGSGDAVAVHGSISTEQQTALRETLMQFHPWRKGPFDVFGVHIDTEWRSDLKWQRLCEAVEFRDRTVLDVGCGNGYYGWKMLAAGADLVVGCDPMLLYTMQYEVFRRYAGAPERHFLVPLADSELPARLSCFDVTLSLGVLYHRSSPIDHLQALCDSLRPGGQLVLETLIVESDREDVLVPEDRYAKMRNVWFIPSIPMLMRWLRRTGFSQIELVDVTRTTSAEQRSTEWMTFESLADFLDPDNSGLTLEGYLAPTRAIITAQRQ